MKLSEIFTITRYDQKMYISFILLSNETEESLSRSRKPQTTNTICHPYSLRVAFFVAVCCKVEYTEL